MKRFLFFVVFSTFLQKYMYWLLIISNTCRNFFRIMFMPFPLHIFSSFISILITIIPINLYFLKYYLLFMKKLEWSPVHVVSIQAFYRRYTIPTATNATATTIKTFANVSNLFSPYSIFSHFGF